MLPTHDDLALNVKNRNLALNWLLITYPDAFDLCNRRPLKQDILLDILDFKIKDMPNKDDLEQAYLHYTQWGSYLNALKVDTKCIDLNGQPCGLVSHEEAELAQKKLSLAQNKMIQTL